MSLMNFKKIRIMNWIYTILFIPLCILVLLNFARSASFIGLIPISFAVLFFIAPFFLSAVILSGESFNLFGFSLNFAKRTFWIKFTWILNLFLLIFSIIGVFMCISTGQYPPIVTFLFYIIPSVLNVYALTKIKKLKSFDEKISS